MLESLLDASAWILPLLIAVIAHEVAHGWVAERLGDDTARRAGRITLNPLSHIDRNTTIILPALLWLANSPVILGAAKPVPVDFTRLRPLRIGMIAVAIAGPGVNVLFALLAGIMLHMDAIITPEQAPWLFMNIYRFLTINCVLAMFNLIPLLPLDGGRVVYALLRGRAQRWFGAMEKPGVFILLALLIIPAMLGYPLLQELVSGPVMGLLKLVMLATGNSA